MNTLEYLKENSVKLKSHEQLELWNRWVENNDTEAKDLLARGVYALLIRQAQMKARDCLSSFEDLLHVGFFAIERTFATYNPRKGRLFSTHFYEWFRSLSGHEIKKNQVVKLPSHVSLTNTWVKVSFNQTDGMELDFPESRREPMFFIDVENQTNQVRSCYGMRKSKQGVQLEQPQLF
jgi:DNA-directed RNA polymerase sigma subunit (sigma70/sigma32)